MRPGAKQAPSGFCNHTGAVEKSPLRSLTARKATSTGAHSAHKRRGRHGLGTLGDKLIGFDRADDDVIVLITFPLKFHGAAWRRAIQPTFCYSSLALLVFSIAVSVTRVGEVGLRTSGQRAP
jgi:hypothetical protein